MFLENRQLPAYSSAADGQKCTPSYIQDKDEGPDLQQVLIDPLGLVNLH